MLRNFDILKILAILGILAITMISIGDRHGESRWKWFHAAIGKWCSRCTRGN